MSYTIRRARTDLDYEDITQLHLITFLGGKDEIPEFHGAWWLLEFNGTPVGFCGVHLSYQWARTAYLCRAGILAKYSGKGQQKKMIRVRERWARSKGVKFMVTDTSPDNYPSSNSLINCKYKIWGPTKDKMWALGYPNAIYWRKRL